MLLAVCCWPYSSSSEVVNGSTNNVTSNGYNWVMQNILPAQTGMTIEGVFHKYTITKDTDADATVFIRNENLGGDGYIYNHTDNWNQLPSNTKIKYDPVPSSLAVLWGRGQIGLLGNGSLSDVNVHYQYRFDTCFIPLTDPSCPDFKNALYQYLVDNDLLNNEPSVDDPYYSEWVQFQLEQKAEEEELKLEEEAEEEEKLEELTIEELFSIEGLNQKLVDPSEQIKMLQALVSVGTLEMYYDVRIEGGTYEDTVQLIDGNIQDNVRAFRSLAQDKTHRSMVRSQYKK